MSLLTEYVTNQQDKGQQILNLYIQLNGYAEFWSIAPSQSHQIQ